MDSTVTSDLMRLQAGRQTAGTRHVRWLVLILAVAVIAVVVAVAVEVTAITTSGKHSAPRPTLPAGQVSTSAPSTSAASTSAASTSVPGATAPAPAPSATPAPIGVSHPVPALLRSGAQQGRAQIPWSQVGHGWFLALADGAAPSAGRALYLVNPIGGRYLITDQLPNPNDRITEWSPDGKRVMLIRDKGATHIITELELATGRVLHTVDIGERGFLGYTRPQGRAILVIRFAGTSPSLERLATDGSHQLTYPRTLLGFGQIGFPVLYTADGTELLVGGQHGIALLGNDGHLIRVLPAPAGAQGCWPATWWNSSTVQETCNFDVSPRYAVLLQPVAGGQPEKLAGASTTYPLGFVNAWRYSKGTVLGEGSGCGPGRLDVLRHGVISTLTLPAGVQDSPPVIGVDGDIITVQRVGGCPISHEESVIAVNLVTGTTTTLFKGSAQLLPYPWQRS